MMIYPSKSMGALRRHQEQHSFEKNEGSGVDSANTPPPPSQVGKPLFSTTISGNTNNKKPEDEDQNIRRGRTQRRHSASEIENDQDVADMHNNLQRLEEHDRQRKRCSVGCSPPLDCDLSIPTSIPLINLNDSSDCGDVDSLSGSSLVSEVTMMTYSDERANLIKEEFFRRLRQESKSLTLQEKKALLEEIQDEQDEKFRRLAEVEKEKRKSDEDRQKMMAKEQEKAQAEVFEKLNQMRLQKQATTEENEQKSKKKHGEELLVIENKRPADKGKEGAFGVDEEGLQAAPSQLRGGRRLAQSFSDRPSGEMRRSRKNGTGLARSFSMMTRAAECQQQQQPERGGGLSILRRSSSLAMSFCSIGTLKQANNSNLNLSRSSRSNENCSWDDQEQQQVPGSIPPVDKLLSMFHDPVAESFGAKNLDPKSSHAKQTNMSCVSTGTSEELEEIERAGATSTLSSDGTSSKGHIEDIIELKMLVANQQATIDTLSSKLHNLELSNRRSLEREHEQRSKLRVLEDENRGLARELDRCRERELSMRNELKLQRERMIRNELESNDRSEELERRNRELAEENSELRRVVEAFEGNRSSTSSGTVPDGIAVTSHNEESGSETEDSS